MKRERVRELLGFDRLLARQWLAAWEYPRAIHDYELLVGSWFAWGESVVFWLCVDTELEEDELGVHVYARPGSAAVLQAREWMRDLVVIGDLLGARRLVARPIDDHGLGRLLSRLGWTRSAGWWYLSLAGGGDGKLEFEQAEEANDAQATREADPLRGD